MGMTAGSIVGIATGKSLFASVRQKISLFAQQLGMKFIAASGKIEIQAQSDDIELIAQKVLKLISTENRIELTAKEILLNGGTSFIRINSDGIYEGTNGKWEVHSAARELTGPDCIPLELPHTHPPQTCEFSNRLDVYDLHYQDEFNSVPYHVVRKNGDTLLKGFLDEHGRTARIEGDQEEDVDVFVGGENWTTEINSDESTYATEGFEDESRLS
jgi:type VI secretion system secreted protein VgrG